jgi:hypothetical protein
MPSQQFKTLCLGIFVANSNPDRFTSKAVDLEFTMFPAKSANQQFVDVSVGKTASNKKNESRTYPIYQFVHFHIFPILIFTTMILIM